MSTAITPIFIEHCDCISPAVALLRCGSFPTTPIRASTWAFDIRLLEFARLLSLYGSPNVSALSNATTAFLLWNGVQNVPESVRSNPFYAKDCPHTCSALDPIQVSAHSTPVLPANTRCNEQFCLEHL